MIKIFSAATSLGSFNKGTELAPREIINSSLKPALDKNNLRYEFMKPFELIGAEMGDNPKLRYHQALVDYNQKLYSGIIDSSSADDVVVCLGGDHSVSIATMFASKLRYSDAVVVYIDAHPDCNGPDATPTGNIHGMPLATVLGDAIYNDFNLPQYNYDEAFLIGIKDADLSEQDYLKQNNILNISMDQVIEKGIAESLGLIRDQIASRPVHVSLDIDSIDMSEAPGTGIINKGGFSFREISYLCRHLADENIVGIDVVEVNPRRDEENKTVHLASELAINLLGGEWSAYNRYLSDKH